MGPVSRVTQHKASSPGYDGLATPRDVPRCSVLINRHWPFSICGVDTPTGAARQLRPLGRSDASSDPRPHPVDLGPQLRGHREALGIGLRELARRLQVSPSLISQIETGKLVPSVSTLFAITNELDISLDRLFSDSEVAGVESQGLQPSRPDGGDPAGGAGVSMSDSATSPNRHRPATTHVAEATVAQTWATDHVQRADSRRVIAMATGVQWADLTAAPDPNVDFLELTYEVGSASSDGGMLMRHPGYEYGIVLSGTLGITVKFDDFQLGPGDSISFDSTIPHRFWNAGDEVVRAIWVVVGKHGNTGHPPVPGS